MTTKQEERLENYIKKMECLAELFTNYKFLEIADYLRLTKDIIKCGDCNVCANKDCGYKPNPGQMVRYNCPFYCENKTEVKK